VGHDGRLDGPDSACPSGAATALSFADDDGAAVEAEGISLRIEWPDGTAVEAVSVPQPYVDLTLDQPGKWFVWLACTGPSPAASTTSFEVRASSV
jgi:hypothetical protein